MWSQAPGRRLVTLVVAGRVQLHYSNQQRGKFLEDELTIE